MNTDKDVHITINMKKPQQDAMAMADDDDKSGITLPSLNKYLNLSETELQENLDAQQTTEMNMVTIFKIF